MTDHDATLEEIGRTLWRRVRSAASGSMPADAGLIAAWLDGRLDENQRDAVEDLLARSPEWCAAMLAAAHDGSSDAAVHDGPGDTELPRSVMEAAISLVGPGRGRSTVQLTAPWMFDLRRLGWGVGVAALIAVVSAGGFVMGHQTYDNFAETFATADGLAGIGESGIVIAAGELQLLLNDPVLDDGPDLFGDAVVWES
ncbi:MAG: hypothetical protein O7A03_09210 [Alphaproteobacteria bacterium]|nr:hypothetical protein [Alphaproteobacteria bacterium]